MEIKMPVSYSLDIPLPNKSRPVWTDTATLPPVRNLGAELPTIVNYERGPSPASVDGENQDRYVRPAEDLEDDNFDQQNKDNGENYPDCRSKVRCEDRKDRTHRDREREREIRSKDRDDSKRRKRDWLSERARNDDRRSRSRERRSKSSERGDRHRSRSEERRDSWGKGGDVREKHSGRERRYRRSESRERRDRSSSKSGGRRGWSRSGERRERRLPSRERRFISSKSSIRLRSPVRENCSRWLADDNRSHGRDENSRNRKSRDDHRRDRDLHWKERDDRNWNCDRDCHFEKKRRHDLQDLVNEGVRRHRYYYGAARLYRPVGYWQHDDRLWNLTSYAIGRNPRNPVQVPLSTSDKNDTSPKQDNADPMRREQPFERSSGSSVLGSSGNLSSGPSPNDFHDRSFPRLRLRPTDSLLEQSPFAKLGENDSGQKKPTQDSTSKFSSNKKKLQKEEERRKREEKKIDVTDYLKMLSSLLHSDEQKVINIEKQVHYVSVEQRNFEELKMNALNSHGSKEIASKFLESLDSLIAGSKESIKTEIFNHLMKLIEKKFPMSATEESFSQKRETELLFPDNSLDQEDIDSDSSVEIISEYPSLISSYGEKTSSENVFPPAVDMLRSIHFSDGLTPAMPKLENFLIHGQLPKHYFDNAEFTTRRDEDCGRQSDCVAIQPSQEELESSFTVSPSDDVQELKCRNFPQINSPSLCNEVPLSGNHSDIGKNEPVDSTSPLDASNLSQEDNEFTTRCDKDHDRQTDCVAEQPSQEELESSLTGSLLDDVQELKCCNFPQVSSPSFSNEIPFSGDYSDKGKNEPVDNTSPLDAANLNQEDNFNRTSCESPTACVARQPCCTDESVCGHSELSQSDEDMISEHFYELIRSDFPQINSLIRDFDFSNSEDEENNPEVIKSDLSQSNNVCYSPEIWELETLASDRWSSVIDGQSTNPLFAHIKEVSSFSEFEISGSPPRSSTDHHEVLLIEISDDESNNDSDSDSEPTATLIWDPHTQRDEKSEEKYSPTVDAEKDTSSTDCQVGWKWQEDAESHPSCESASGDIGCFSNPSDKLIRRPSFTAESKDFHLAAFSGEESNTAKKTIFHACSECGTSYEQKADVRNHIATVCFKNFFEHCNFCSAFFSTSRDLEKHFKQQHRISEACSFDFKNDTASEPTLFKCASCEVSFKSERCLTQHVAHFHSVGSPSLKTDATLGPQSMTFKCTSCEAIFESKRCLTKHVSRFHYEPTSRKKRDLKNRTATLSDSSKRPFKCTSCKGSFKSKQWLKRHVLLRHSTLSRRAVPVLKNRTAISHDTDNRPYKCTSCKGSFKSKQWLKRHILIRHSELSGRALPESDNCSYKCDSCKASFKSKPWLKRHVSRVHSKLFCCNVCVQTFRTKRELQHHTAFLHSNFKRPHKCPACDGTFRSVKAMDRHILYKHTKCRMFVCAHCNADFKDKFDMTRHIYKVHFDGCPYKCDNCDSVFEREKDLAHHNLKPCQRIIFFDCFICKAKFKSKGFLRRHISSKHF